MAILKSFAKLDPVIYDYLSIGPKNTYMNFLGKLRMR